MFIRSKVIIQTIGYHGFFFISMMDIKLQERRDIYNIEANRRKISLQSKIILRYYYTVNSVDGATCDLIENSLY